MTFAMRGVTPVGSTVFAVVVGAVLGTVIRMSQPQRAKVLLMRIVTSILRVALGLAGGVGDA